MTKQNNKKNKESSEDRASVKSGTVKYTPTRGSDKRKGGHNDPPTTPRPNKKPFAKKPKGSK